MNTETRKWIDWSAVELHYRAGVRSLKGIGAEFGVSDAGIIKRAKRGGWTRDLSARIRAKADALVSADAVSGTVSAQTSASSEREIVEANAELQARVIRSHRSDIQTALNLVRNLIGEMELVSRNRELLEQLAEIVTADDQNDKRRQAFARAASLSIRAGSMDKLASALSKLVALDRQAFGLDRGETAPDPIDEMSREQLEAEFAAMMDRARVINSESNDRSAIRP